MALNQSNKEKKPLKMSLTGLEVELFLLNNKGQTVTRADTLIKKITKGLEIIFSDDGSGLDKSIRNANDIFEKGFSTTNGSGLGLYHLKQIMDEIGGSVAIIPQNKGLGFKITVKKP